MAVTLSYGFVNPSNGDPGSVWFSALNANIVQLNDHIHDGILSAQLPPASISKATITVPASGWYAVAGGYEQVVNTPIGIDPTTYYSVTCYDASNNICYPTINAIASNAIAIYSPDNTFTYTLVFR